jgi:S-adenosylmethionine decarboxylase
MIGRMHGLHLFAELTGCPDKHPLLTDPDSLRAHCLHAVAQAGLHAVGELFHPFPAPGGVTGVVLLAESHVAVHTWPELGAVTLDVYVCNLKTDNSASAEQLMQALEVAFAPRSSQRQRLLRVLGESS